MADLAEHQVIVIGGGPAGSTAAWELVRNGVDVLVLDLATLPREKLCAGWITPEVVADLEFEPADYPHRFLTFAALDVAVRGMVKKLKIYSGDKHEHSAQQPKPLTI